ncbi:hypothetical protein GBA52_003811 [Prunus armeniaca]|nr:hypothetical protein GBA52_003811 [Prunus armeniaca]
MTLATTNYISACKAMPPLVYHGMERFRPTPNSSTFNVLLNAYVEVGVFSDRTQFEFVDF